MNIGIFGGAFNPPHVGHLLVAEAVREHLKLDKVFFIPSADPPHRQDVGRATAEARLEMTGLAVQGHRSFDVSDVELKRSGKSYTIDTLATFEALYPRARLFLLIGSDNFAEFHTWRSPHEILTKCELIVFSRPNFPVQDVKHEFARAAQIVNVPAINISASDIRRRVKMSRSIRYMVPQSVEEFIVRRGLYRK